MKKVVLLLLTVPLTLANPCPNDIPSPTFQDHRKPCILRNTGKNGEKVCVCNSTYCDNIPRPQKVEPPVFIRYTTSEDGLRFARNFGSFNKCDGRTKSMKNLYISYKQRYQEIIGWGGAFTDATGINIKSLDEKAQDLLLESYFSDHGIKYTLCRVPIGCSDFSTHPYTYDDTNKPDPHLLNFTLAKEDAEYKIYYMTKAKMLNKMLNFIATPWTSPRWMKTNNEYSGLDSYIKKEYYQSWADYILYFLLEYVERGFYFWAITTQNEPTFGTDPFVAQPLVTWNASEMGVWIGENLGPTIRNSIFMDVKIFTVDDQVTQIPQYLDTIMSNSNASNYVDGIATHWYATNASSGPRILHTREKYPNMPLLSTEASTGFRNSSGVSLGSWERGEKYGSDIIEDLKRYYSGWIDWNLVLDTRGGPNYIDNFVDAPIIVNASAGEFYKQPMYYFLGHFSKFLPPGSVRIDSKDDFDRQTVAVAFTVPDNGNEITDDDGATIVVVLNRADQAKNFALVDEVMGTAEVTVPRKSISTFLYWPS